MEQNTVPGRQHSESSASSSSSSFGDNAPPLPHLPPTPKDPPKIPPPPSEHPPPYTPFGGQSSSLLPGNQAQRDGHPATNRRVVDPPGFRKYIRHLTARNVLIALALICALIVFIYLVHWSNQSDKDLSTAKALEESHAPLAVSHKGLGPVKGKRDRISFDESTDSVVLSEFDPENRVLRAEMIKLDEHLAGFRQITTDLGQMEWAKGAAEGEKQLAFDDCMRFNGQLVCCSTPSESRQHLTKCFLHQIRGQNYISVAAMFDFVPQWQSLLDGDMLLVRNRQRQAVLDLRRNILHQIDENSLPRGYISQGFYFPRETSDELAELVRHGEQFRICEYVRTHQVDQEHGKYALKEEECRQTPFKMDPELMPVLFCVNSLYTALLQYGHLKGESTMLTWRLRVKFDSSPTVYSTGDSVHALQEQVAMDCDDGRISIFVLGDHELHQFWTELPKIRNGHFGNLQQ